MNFVEKNKTTLAGMQSINEALKSLEIDGEELVLGNKRVNISKFDMSLLMGEQLPFESQLTTLTPEDVYKIVSLHAITLESKAKNLDDNKNKAELEALKAKNPSLSNIVISTRKTADGSTEEYINIVDSEGRDHLLHNYYHIDLIQMYMEALNIFGTTDITPEQLYEVFKRRCNEVSLDDTYNMTHKSDTSKEFITKMNDFESKHVNDKHYALGNEENDILISNDHTVTSYDRDKDGNLIQRDFSDSTVPGGEIGVDGSNGDVQHDDESAVLGENEADELVENEEEKKVIDLISEEEFYELINKTTGLTEDEVKQVQLFNSYLEDLMVYRDYLLPELKEILAKFEQVMEQYSVAEDLNENQSKELQEYYDMQTRKEQRLTNSDSLNMDKEVQKLKLVMPEKQGVANPTAIILIMSALVMIMGIVAVLISR